MRIKTENLSKSPADSSHAIFQVLLLIQEGEDRQIQELAEETDLVGYLHEYLEEDLSATEEFLNRLQKGVDQSLSEKNRSRFYTLLRELEQTATSKRTVADSVGMADSYYSDNLELEEYDDVANSIYLILQMMSVMKDESASSLKGQLEFGGLSRYLDELFNYLRHMEGLVSRRYNLLSAVSDSVSETIEAVYHDGGDMDLGKFAELINDLKHITELELVVTASMLKGMFTYEEEVKAITSPELALPH